MRTAATLGVRLLLLTVILANAGCAAVVAGVVGGVAGGATYSMLSANTDAEPVGNASIVPVSGREVGASPGPCVGTTTLSGR